MMKRTFIAMACLLLLGLCGCPSPLDGTCAVAPTPASNAPVALLVAGEPVNMSLSPFESGSGCPPVGVLPDSLSAEISGPDGQPVANETSMNLPSSLTGSLRFTPEKPGRHHFLAAFEPVGGIQQFDLHVARDRSTETSPESLRDTCNTLERTDHGALVCDSRIFRTDQPAFLLPPGKSAVAGNVVWVVSEQRVERYVDTGTKIELSATQNNINGSAVFLLAAPDELLVLYAQALHRIIFNGASLVVTGLTPWQGATDPINGYGLKGILLRAGSRLALVSRTSASQGFVLQACAYQLDAGNILRTSEPCQALAGVLLGFEPSVLWMGDETVSTQGQMLELLRRMEWTGSQLETRGSLAVGPSLQFRLSAMRGSTSVPVLGGAPFELRGLPMRTGVPVYLPGQGQLILESLDEQISQPEASPTLFWGPLPSGGSRMRLRPTAP